MEKSSYTEADLPALTASIRPTVEAIHEQSSGVVCFDPKGVRLYGFGDVGPCDTPAIGWWIDTDQLPYGDDAIPIDSDIRAAVVERLRMQAAELSEAAGRLEAGVSA